MITLTTWLEDLAAKQATPGGGAAAGLAAATAAALIGMVSVYTTGDRWLDRDAEMRQINDQATELRQQALQLMKDDETAFQAVGTAYARPADDDTRQAAIQTALRAAAEPPRQVAVVAAEIVMLAANLVNRANPNVLSDVAVAASLARAAIEAAAVNIEVNAQLITSSSVQKELYRAAAACSEALQQAQAICDVIRTKLRSHEG